MLYHDSHDAKYRVPVGPVPAGGTLCLRFLCDEGENVTLRTWNGEERRISMTAIGGGLFEASITVPGEPTLLWYDFII
ncbi:MAG: hypothetical protein RSC91_08985, partial [Clostridia bacterium]